MPKMKTKRGALKRFRARANGYKCRRANRNHILTKKTKKRKRQIRGPHAIAACDVPSVARMLGDA